MPPTPHGTLPKTDTDWLNAAQRAQVQDTSLLGFRDHHSGSQVTFRQFLTFRTLVFPHQADSFDPAQWGLAQELAIATQELNESQDFQSLLHAMRHPPAQPTGDFSQILKMYAEVNRVPDNRYPKKLQKADESPVNVSLICLLQALADVPTKAAAEWRHTKVRFEARFGTLANGVKRKMTAITDGQLQSTTSHEVRAIVECKGRARNPHDILISMQEAALFVAWIKECPGSPNSRILVSQDKVQLFLTFAETPIQWREYLLLNRISGVQRSFMGLHRYGPWNLRREDHLREAAAIVRAISKV